MNIYSYADEERGRILQQLRAAFPRPEFNVGYNREGYFWVLQVKGRATAKYVEELECPHAESDVVDSMRAQLGIVEGEWPAVSNWLDELATAISADVPRNDGTLAPDGFCICRNCGFRLAAATLHRQTMERSESCPRCGFDCSVPLENSSGVDTGPLGKFDSLDVLDVGEAIACPVCDSKMVVCIEERTDGRSLVAYCRTCECLVESTNTAA